ncbi:MAG: hypothetical protein MK486_21735, partial [Gemmatimonadetes bacterium]|nr:hypothetical protein [Gemmatimonadota bacterium]
MRVNRLITGAINVLEAGPVHDLLEEGIDALASRREAGLQPPDDYLPPPSDIVGWEYVRSIMRLLLRVKSHAHGGAIVIVPNDSPDGINIKHSLAYDRLGEAIVARTSTWIGRDISSNAVHDEDLDVDSPTVPADAYRDQVTTRGDLDDSDAELDATLWFVSLLTRVDGAVVINQEL